MRQKIIGTLALLITLLMPVTPVLADGGSVEVTADDPDKIPLTQEFLRGEYEKFFATREQMSDVFSIMILVFIGLFLLILAIYVIKNIRDAAREKAESEYGEVIRSSGPDTSSLSRWIRLIPAVPFLIVLIFVYFRFSNTLTVPKPEDATLNIYHIEVVRKDTEVHRNNNNHSTTTNYYLYIKNADLTERKMPVNINMYDSVGDPGMYFIAYAETDTEHEPFAIYSPDIYTPSTK